MCGQLVIPLNGEAVELANQSNRQQKVHATVGTHPHLLNKAKRKIEALGVRLSRD